MPQQRINEQRALVIPELPSAWGLLRNKGDLDSAEAAHEVAIRHRHRDQTLTRPPNLCERSLSAPGKQGFLRPE